MKNLTKLVVLTGSLFLGCMSSDALQISQTIFPGNLTNIITTFNNAPIKVTQIIVTCPTATNVSGLFIDTPTNSIVYTNAPYTASISYATNYVTFQGGTNYSAYWTNYYGAVNSITNLGYNGTAGWSTNLYIVDATITVPGSTNAYPSRVGVAATTANNPAIFTGVNYYFQNGCWFTNTGSGTVQITLIFQE